MKFLKNIINKNNLFKYFSDSIKNNIKKTSEYNFKLNENKEFDIYKYFLLPIEERKYYKW